MTFNGCGKNKQLSQALQMCHNCTMTLFVPPQISINRASLHISMVRQVPRNVRLGELVLLRSDVDSFYQYLAGTAWRGLLSNRCVRLGVSPTRVRLSRSFGGGGDLACRTCVH
jgi:hypothetical protein